MSRRQTPHVKRERSREKRALDRAIIRCVRQLGWSTGPGIPLLIHAQDQAELVGLAIARKRL